MQASYPPPLVTLPKARSLLRLRPMLAVLALVVVGCAQPDPLPAAPPISATPDPPTTFAGPGTGAPASAGPVELAYRPVVEGMSSTPVMLTARPGADHSYVATKQGRVWRLAGGELTEILDISGQVTDNHEQGMLGMALDPRADDLLYLHYTDTDGDTVVSTFRFADDGTLDPRSERLVLTVDQPRPTHNGGMIQFGPRGMLYVGLGDGGGIGDPDGNGQDPGDLLGNILRIDPHGGEPYAIPDTNPFVDGSGAGEVWVHGLRNPWRFWIDSYTERVYIGDVGQALSEEINVVGLDGAGTNFGWSITEGNHCYGTETEPAPSCDTDGLTAPLVELERRGNPNVCAVTGGVVYRGEEIGALRGHYLYSDYCGGWLRSLSWEGGDAPVRHDWTDQVGEAGRVVSFGVDGRGEVYVLTETSILRLTVP